MDKLITYLSILLFFILMAGAAMDIKIVWMTAMWLLVVITNVAIFHHFINKSGNK